jgi:hypothetical protein
MLGSRVGPGTELAAVKELGVESTALEVGIGLAVIFFLTATVVTAANEALTRLLNFRSKALWATLGTLLTPSGSGTRNPLHLGFLRTVLNPGAGPRPTVPAAPHAPPAAPPAAVAGAPVVGAVAVAADPTDDLVATPSVWSLDYVKGQGTTKVWNIPTDVFTGALLELATIKGAGDTVESKVATLVDRYQGSPLGSYLAGISTSAAADLDKFTDHVGAWFDGQMQRLTDSYRRLTKYLLAAIGLLVAFAFNVDAIAIASGLATNADERQAVVLLADNLDESGLPCPDGTETTDALTCAAANLASLESIDVHYPFQTSWQDSWEAWFSQGWWAHLLGLFLTAFAVGLGGPFWFDTVGALAGLRRKQS